jgi:hypothetical protein
MLEAKFQWSHARDLKPDPDELKTIEEKLQNGLATSAVEAQKTKKAGGG